MRDNVNCRRRHSRNRSVSHSLPRSPFGEMEGIEGIGKNEEWHRELTDVLLFSLSLLPLAPICYLILLLTTRHPYIPSPYDTLSRDHFSNPPVSLSIRSNR